MEAIDFTSTLEMIFLFKNDCHFASMPLFIEMIISEF